MFNHVKRYRKIKGLTQEELADMTELGISTIQHVENGHVNPTIMTALLIAKALDTTVDDLWMAYDRA